MNISESLTKSAEKFPNNEAVVFEGKRYTYAQLNALSIAAAQQLQTAGIEPGDRVAIMLPNAPAFVVWYYGALRIGAIVVSISTRLTQNEVAFMTADCGAKVFVAVTDLMQQVEEGLPECVASRIAVNELGTAASGATLQPATEISPPLSCDPNEPALILYTSGTTGAAKGATLSHNNVRTNVRAFNVCCHMKSSSRILLAVPLFHCFGQNALLNSAFNVGATLVFQRSFDLNESKRLIGEEQVTQLYGVPMMFQLLLEHCEPADLASVNYCFSAAATLPQPICERWLKKFELPIHEGYGLTETSPFASYNHQTEYEIGSIGSPIENVEMKIVDPESGDDCEVGDAGEIVIRGPNVMLGYWNRPEDTANAIQNGWFHSGDIGHQDQQGHFYIGDRVKDMIAVGGLKVYPAEVEAVLLECEGISQVAVVGFPDEVFGEQVVAFVVYSDTADEGKTSQTISQLTKERLANYKRPRQLITVDKLPRNPSGKILKTKLREMAPQYELKNRPAFADSKRPPSLRKKLAATHEASRPTAAVQFVQTVVQEITDSTDPPDPDSRFLEAGLDSLGVVELSSQMQIEVGDEHELPATLVFDFPRIRDLAEFMVQALASPTSKQEAEKPTLNPSAVPADNLRKDVEELSEEEALEQLMKELE